MPHITTMESITVCINTCSLPSTGEKETGQFAHASRAIKHAKLPNLFPEIFGKPVLCRRATIAFADHLDQPLGLLGPQESPGFRRRGSVVCFVHGHRVYEGQLPKPIEQKSPVRSGQEYSNLPPFNGMEALAVQRKRPCCTIGYSRKTLTSIPSAPNISAGNPGA